MLFARTKTSVPPSPPDLEAQARQHRDRMAGLWAAELLGLIGHAAHDYARALARAHEQHDGAGTVRDTGEDAVVSRLVRDLRGKVGAREIRDKLAHLLHEARRQLHAEGRKH